MKGAQDVCRTEKQFEWGPYDRAASEVLGRTPVLALGVVKSQMQALITEDAHGLDLSYCAAD